MPEEKNNEVPAVAQEPKPSKDAEAMQSISAFVSKMQSLRNMVIESGKTMEEATQLGDAMIKKILPLMKEKTETIQKLEEQVKKFEAIAGQALKDADKAEKKKK